VATPGQVPPTVPETYAGIPPYTWPERPTHIAVIALGADTPSSWVETDADAWLAALEASPVFRKHGYGITPLRTADKIIAALQATGSDRPLAIVNPGGEVFYAETTAGWEAMIEAIGTYVRNGGIWWETGGYSFYSCAVPVVKDGVVTGWGKKGVGTSAAERLGFRCAGYDVEQPAEPMLLTTTGREWFGKERAARLEALTAGVQRSFAGTNEDVVLLRGAEDDFCAAIRCGGWGWLWRLGGFTPPTDVATDAVVGVIEYLATHPWPSPALDPETRLWNISISAGK